MSLRYEQQLHWHRKRIEELEAKLINERLEAELAEANKKASQRGARMQIIWEFMRFYTSSEAPTPRQQFLKDHPEAAGWFDDDGVPR